MKPFSPFVLLVCGRLIVALLLASGQAAAIDGRRDPAFRPQFRAPVNTDFAVPNSDGSWLVGGGFNFYLGGARRPVARLAADGRLDASFAPSVARPAVAAVRQRDGGVICLEERANSTKLFRLTANGAVDPSFVGPAGTVKGIRTVLAVTADDRLLVSRPTSLYRDILVRLLPDGREDPSFLGGEGAGGAIPAAGAEILGVRPMPDGSILVWGSFSFYHGVQAPGLTRLRPDGSVDEAFRPEFPAARGIRDVRPAGDGGALVLMGELPEQITRRTLVRLDARGAQVFVREAPHDPRQAHDTVAWVPRAEGGSRAVAQPYTGFVIPRVYNPAVEVTDLAADGSVERTASHSVPEATTVWPLGVSAAGEALFAERAAMLDDATFPPSREHLFLLRPGAAAADSFAELPGETSDALVQGLVAAPGGRALAWGSFHSVDGVPAPAGVAVLGADGRWEARSLAGLELLAGRISDIIALPTGGWALTGRFTDKTLMPYLPFVRLDADGGVNGDWFAAARDSGITKGVRLAADAQGRVLVLGRAQADAGTFSGGKLVRVRLDGTLDPGFQADSFTGSVPNDLAVLPDGRVYVGASARGYLSPGYFQLLRLLADGRADPSFDRANADHTAGFAARPDGSVAVVSSMFNGPAFSEGAPGQRVRMSLLRADGSTDPAFVERGRFDGVLTGVRLLRDGRFLLDGDFLFLGERSRFGMARLGTDGTLDANFRPDLPVTAGVTPGLADGLRLTGARALAELPDGALLVAAAAGLDPLVKLLVDPQPMVPAKGRGQLVNLSTRGSVGNDDRALIAGFVVTGGTRRVIVRALGPSLAADGVTGVLANPSLEVLAAGQRVGVNDDWAAGSAAAEITAAGLAPKDARESALLLTLSPGTYTAVVRGVGRTEGVSLVEVNVLDAPDFASPPPPSGAPRAANLSTRAFVGGGDAVLIGGFAVRGGSARVVLRGLGPTLAGAGVPGALADPYLRVVRQADGKQIYGADSWTQQISGPGNTQPLVLPPLANAEVGTVLDLPEGNYTVIVSGSDSGTGIGMFEVYELPDNGTP